MINSEISITNNNIYMLSIEGKDFSKDSDVINGYIEKVYDVICAPLICSERALFQIRGDLKKTDLKTVKNIEQYLLNYNNKDNNVNYETCPICGKNIYISNHLHNFACEDINCPLGHGAKDLIDKINNVLNKVCK